jgi:hypothetical protein
LLQLVVLQLLLSLLLLHFLCCYPCTHGAGSSSK